MMWQHVTTVLVPLRYIRGGPIYERYESGQLSIDRYRRNEMRFKFVIAVAAALGAMSTGAFAEGDAAKGE